MLFLFPSLDPYIVNGLVLFSQALDMLIVETSQEPPRESFDTSMTSC